MPSHDENYEGPEGFAELGVGIPNDSQRKETHRGLTQCNRYNFDDLPEDAPLNNFQNMSVCEADGMSTQAGLVHFVYENSASYRTRLSSVRPI